MNAQKNSLGVIHKPRGKLREDGRGLANILYHKPYLVKVTTKGGGGVKNTQKGMWSKKSME